jgi:hypothetical protein
MFGDMAHSSSNSKAKRSSSTGMIAECGNRKSNARHPAEE